MSNDIEIKKWICNKLKLKSEELNFLYKNNFALNYFFIWTIFERTNFDKFMKIDKIDEFTKNKKDTAKDLEEIFYYFYSRYKIRGNNKSERNKKKKNRRNLCYQVNCSTSKCENYNKCTFYKILDKDIKKIKPEEKIYLLTYVVYRYRNNMFHGSKGLESWAKYTEQINKCIEIMMILTK